MNVLLVAAITAALVGYAALCAAEEKLSGPSSTKRDPAKFVALRSLQQFSAKPMLGNGLVPDSKEWPASFWDETLRCSATLIGPRVLLTAAHCVDNGPDASIVSGNEDYGGPCTQHPDWVQGADLSADYALCALTRKVPGVPYERINTDTKAVALGTRLTLSGYGCVTLSTDGPIDNLFRIGTAVVTGLPGGPHKTNTITTSVYEEGAMLCRGDSGGAAFTSSTGARRVVAVNSHAKPGEKKTSSLASITTPAARKFIADWVGNDLARGICGVSAQVEGCR